MPFSSNVFESVRPLVRYTDRDRAVVECWLTQHKPLATPRLGQPPQPDIDIDLVLHVTTQAGFEDEDRRHVRTQHGSACARFDLVSPDLWWPATLGEQTLYAFSLRVEVEGVTLHEQTYELGLTSVRWDGNTLESQGLLVNGVPSGVQSVVHIDRVDHNKLLPAGAEALMVVRDHYAPDLFYDATDRAGILAMQCVPIEADAMPEKHLAQHVRRLAAHPSLVGWYVGHQGPAADALARRIRSLDPTRAVYRDVPAA